MLGELISFGSGDGTWEIYLRINKIMISGENNDLWRKGQIKEPKRACKFALLADGQNYLLID